MNIVQDALQQWKELLENETDETLKKRENGEGWTLGQLYVHLIESTIYFSKQVKSCLQSTDNRNEPLLPKAAAIFQAGSLPDIRIEGPASNSQTREPEGRQFLKDSFTRLIEKFGQLETAIAEKPESGKARHPGTLGYFNAAEWMQFTAIHLKHHLRQYQRITGKLAENR